MISYYSRTYPVGWQYWADVFCKGCGDSLPEIDPEGNDKHPIMGWETGDLSHEIDGETVPMCCGQCGEPASQW